MNYINFLKLTFWIFWKWTKEGRAFTWSMIFFPSEATFNVLFQLSWFEKAITECYKNYKNLINKTSWLQLILQECKLNNIQVNLIIILLIFVKKQTLLGKSNGSWIAIILQENWIGRRCEFLQFSPYSVGVYYFCTVEWYCLCKYPDIKLYGHHEMVAEDSILPASKTLALAQWKILLIFFHIKLIHTRMAKGCGTRRRNLLKQLLGRYFKPFPIRGYVR